MAISAWSCRETRCSPCPTPGRRPNSPIWSPTRAGSGFPLVAITGRRDSALAGAADIVLLLPAAGEACPMGLAPTTSTTMQMALGDALAVALLTRRGFTAADFRQFHPGGRLGARLRRVRELMHEGDALPLAEPDSPDGPRPAAP